MVESEIIKLKVLRKFDDAVTELQETVFEKVGSESDEMKQGNRTITNLNLLATNPDQKYRTVIAVYIVI
jgi:hypothetical protein